MNEEKQYNIDFRLKIGVFAVPDVEIKEHAKGVKNYTYAQDMPQVYGVLDYKGDMVINAHNEDEAREKAEKVLTNTDNWKIRRYGSVEDVSVEYMNIK